jgi:hypothetical protein
MTPIYVAQIVKKRNTHKDLFRKSEAKGQFGTARRRWNDELYDLYSSPNIVRVIKSRRMRWAGHVARMGRGEVFTGFWLGSPKVRDHCEDLDVGRKITLRWTLGRQGSMG